MGKKNAMPLADWQLCEGRCERCPLAGAILRRPFAPPILALTPRTAGIAGGERDFARLLGFLCTFGPRHPPSREAAARIAWMSDRGFTRRFRQAFGVSWRSFLVAWRHLSARRLLEHGTREADVATHLGYSSKRSLRRVLRPEVPARP